MTHEWSGGRDFPLPVLTLRSSGWNPLALATLKSHNPGAPTRGQRRSPVDLDPFTACGCPSGPAPPGEMSLPSSSLSQPFPAAAAAKPLPGTPFSLFGLGSAHQISLFHHVGHDTPWHSAVPPPPTTLSFSTPVWFSSCAISIPRRTALGEIQRAT